MLTVCTVALFPTHNHTYTRIHALLLFTLHTITRTHAYACKRMAHAYSIFLLPVIDQIADHSKYLAPFFMREEEVVSITYPLGFLLNNFLTGATKTKFDNFYFVSTLA